MPHVTASPLILDGLTGFPWPTQPDPRMNGLLKRAAGKGKKIGGPTRTDHNLEVVLGNDPRICKQIRYDEFSDQVFVGNAVLDETLEFHVGVWLERTYALVMAGPRIHAALVASAKRRPFHPVRDYLKARTWDGQARIDFFLRDFMGVRDSALSRSLSRLWFIGAVARAYEPGCKLDTTMILVGRQGARKSQALAALVPVASWFSDTPLDLRSKDCYQSIQGKWLYELAELNSVQRAEVARVKAFLSSQADNYRPPYGRMNVVRQRHVVLVGSTNEQEFLADPTGSRRFWPVLTGECDPDGVERERDKLWAEAVAAFHQGEAWWLDDPEERKLATTSDRFQVTDPWEEPVRDWLARQGSAAFTLAQALEGACGKETSDQTGTDAMRIVRVLTKLGCVKAGNIRINGERRNWWRAGRGGSGSGSVASASSASPAPSNVIVLEL